MGMENKKGITETVKSLGIGESREFPLAWLPSVMPICSKYKLLNPGWDYTSKTDRERRVITVTRVN